MKLVRWTMLVVGTAMVSLFVMTLALLAVASQDFGGIPWSWDLLRVNVGWVALLLCGLLLVGVAASLFLSERRSSRPAAPDLLD